MSGGSTASTPTASSISGKWTTLRIEPKTLHLREVIGIPIKNLHFAGLFVIVNRAAIADLSASTHRQSPCAKVE